MTTIYEKALIPFPVKKKIHRKNKSNMARELAKKWGVPLIMWDTKRGRKKRKTRHTQSR